jgi:ABC-2 type transport system ATP-binding protein
MPVPTLQVTGLTKTYGQRRAVSDLTFGADRGDIVGFVGPNGAGKTTTIRMLSTLLEPTSGDFRVAGIARDRPAEIRRRIGVLPESVGYPAGRTGQEYLRFFGRLCGLGRSAADRKARDLLDEFGLGERADSPISTYSRGMRQRLGIARAVVNDPAVVFLDEPTLGLDPAGQRQMLSTVRGLAERRGATVLLSTHALGAVEEVCSSVVVLDRGTVVRAGSVTDVSRAAGPLTSVRLRVPADQVDAARAAVERLGHPGLVVESSPSGLLVVAAPEPADDVGTAVLRAVLDAAVPVFRFDAGGERLSEAFLSMTAGNRR